MNTASKIVTIAQAQAQVKAWQTEGNQVVFTNGCFDILHVGHVDYLEKASNLGQKLVLGLNTDASVSRIKGPLRPVCNEFSRSRVIAALAFVDLVVFFDEETPQALISALMPNILVKGDDYTIATIVGADVVLANGGTVKTIPLVEGYSTSTVIKNILAAEGK
jgi:rfaE bifunctional protein nucleotidyltransferase chain/domain